MAETEIHDPLLHQLREERLLTAQQVEDITDEHERTGKPVRQLLIDLGLLTEEQILGVISRVLGARQIRLRDLDILPDVIRAAPVSVVRMYNMVPVETGPNSVVLATSDLPSPEVTDELQFVLTRDISFVIASEEDIKSQINRFYGEESESVTEMLSALENDLENAGDEIAVKGGDDISALAQAANATPVVRFVNLVMYQAVQNRASDIHFEPFETEFKIRYRVDGAL